MYNSAIQIEKQPKKPIPIKVNFDGIPKELRDLPNWVVWEYEYRQDKKDKNKVKWTKVPYVATDQPMIGTKHQHASTTDSDTWRPFDTARTEYLDRCIDGIGINLQPPYCGTDLDHCRDKDTGELSDFAKKVIYEIQSYTEVSPSGTGIRIILRATLPVTNGKTRNRDDKLGIEIYDNSRYLTITGNHVPGTPTEIMDRQAELEKLHAELFPQLAEQAYQDSVCNKATPDRISTLADQRIIELACNAKNGSKVQKLLSGDWQGEYESQSSADLALCSLLAFYTQDPDQIDRLFRASGLYREKKWGDRQDYRDNTIQMALDGISDVYKGDQATEFSRLQDQAEAIVKPYESEQDGSDADSGQEQANQDGEQASPEGSGPTLGASKEQTQQQERGEQQEKKEPRTAAEILSDVLGEKLKPDPKIDAKRFKFQPMSSAEFDAADFRQEWAVKNLLVKGQPMIIAGPKKSLKTNLSIALALALGSGRSFLGQFEVIRPQRTVVISGESGMGTIQETARRICYAMNLKLKDVNVGWQELLPQLSKEEELQILSAGLKAGGYEVAIIDPLYLCLLAGTQGKSASNMFDIGPILYEAGRACLDVGCTPILNTHARKNSVSYEPMELEDISHSGTQEFARQWILVNRRKRYDPDQQGSHKLWLQVGGSSGQSGCWGIDVEEGQLQENFQGRKWDVTVLSASEARKEVEEAKEQKKNNKKICDEQEARAKLLEVLDRYKDEGPTRSQLSDETGFRLPKLDRILTIMRDIVEEYESEYKSGKGGTKKCTRWRRKIQ